MEVCGTMLVTIRAVEVWILSFLFVKVTRSNASNVFPRALLKNTPTPFRLHRQLHGFETCRARNHIVEDE